MLLEMIKYIFSSFWRWAGFFLILVVLTQAVIDLIKVIFTGISNCISAKTGYYLEDQDSESEDTSSDESEATHTTEN